MDDGLTPVLRARVIGIPAMASRHSSLRSCLLYINGTERMVGVFWMDYNGYQVHYRTLRPGLGMEVDTYLTHPWIFRDMTTGERMHVFHKDVYYPEMYRVRENNAFNDHWVSCRRQLHIHYPLDSLRSRCLWSLAKYIDRNVIKASILQDLPFVLRCDLKKIQGVTAKHQQYLMRGAMNR